MRAGDRPVGQRTLVDLAFDAMFVRGFHDRVISFWNEGAERLYGWAREEAIGKVPRDLLGSVYPIPLEEIEDQLSTTGRWEGLIKQQRKDGSPVLVAARWGLQTDAAAKPSAILEINSDVSPSSVVNERLRRSEERFELLVSSVMDYAIFMLDTEGVISSWNTGAQRIKGYSAAEIIGRHFSIFYPPEDIADGKPARELVIAEREGKYEEEGWRLRKDGTRFWASVVITALKDETGQLRGFGKVTRDLTERRLAEERREAEVQAEADRLREYAARMAHLESTKAQFLNIASHELRGPLTVVRGYNSMLQDGSIPAEKIASVASLVEAKLAQMDTLVEQMLEIARIEHERFALNLELFDLRAVAADQLNALAPLAENHQLVMTPGSDRVMVEGDRSRITMVIGNLVDNALKYSPNGGDVTCTVTLDGPWARLAIHDNGIGIRPEHIATLFSRFGRLPTEENISIPGTGLGLYLCREIARRHGGDITVVSEFEKGSEFVLTLPLEQPLGAEGLSSPRGGPVRL